MKATFFKFIIAIIAISLGLWLLSDPTSTGNTGKATQPPITVSVLAVTPKTYYSETDTTGLIKPRWNLTIRANVRGKIVHSYEDILPGSRVTKGQLLAQVDEVEYQASLARAKADAANAKLALAKVLNEQSVAKRINQASTNSDFRLLKPHVAAAKATLQAAIDNVAAVQQQLDDTQIRAPFDAIVLGKYIVPSQHVSLGDTVYELASSASLDVHVSLSNVQWQRIGVHQHTQAVISNQLGQSSTATIRYVAPSVDAQTRQLSVVLNVAASDQGDSVFHPEQLVKVSFVGQPINHGVLAPATVLTRDNQVWTIDGDTLKLESVHVIDERNNTVTFQFTERPYAARELVLYPLSTMIEGQRVAPTLVANDTGAAL